MSKLNNTFLNKVVRVMTNISDTADQGSGDYVVGFRAYEGVFVDSDSRFVYLGVYAESTYKLRPVMAIKVDYVVAIETIDEELSDNEPTKGTLN